MYKLICVFTFISIIFAEDDFYFMKKCSARDPNLNKCLQRSANYLMSHIRRGIPELRISSPEPVIIDEISISLGDGPNGYRGTFKDIYVYGISNLTITSVRSDIPTRQFQFSFAVPKLSVRAKFESSGVLIIVPASGGGDYWGEYSGARAKVYVRCDLVNRYGAQYLNLQEIKMDFSVKDIKMGVENVHNQNAIIQAALNLFINSNAQDLLKEMKPDLRKKLLVLMSGFVQNLFGQVPFSKWATDYEYV